MLFSLPSLCVVVQIEMLLGRWHNLPNFPTFISSINGLAMGAIPHMTEPLWSWAMGLLGDDFYSRKRAAASAATSRPGYGTGYGASAPTYGTGYGTTAPTTGVTSAIGSSATAAAEAARPATATTVDAAIAGKEAAADAMYDAMDYVESSVADWTRFVYDTVMGTAAGAAEVVQGYGEKAAEDVGAVTAPVRGAADRVTTAAQREYEVSKGQTKEQIDGTAAAAAMAASAGAQKVVDKVRGVAATAQQEYVSSKEGTYGAGVDTVEGAKQRVGKVVGAAQGEYEAGREGTIEKGMEVKERAADAVGGRGGRRVGSPAGVLA